MPARAYSIAWERLHSWTGDPTCRRARHFRPFRYRRTCLPIRSLQVQILIYVFAFSSYGHGAHDPPMLSEKYILSFPMSCLDGVSRTHVYHVHTFSTISQGSQRCVSKDTIVPGVHGVLDDVPASWCAWLAWCALSPWSPWCACLVSLVCLMCLVCMMCLVCLACLVCKLHGVPGVPVVCDGVPASWCARCAWCAWCAWCVWYGWFPWCACLVFLVCLMCMVCPMCLVCLACLLCQLHGVPGVPEGVM